LLLLPPIPAGPPSRQIGLLCPVPLLRLDFWVPLLCSEKKTEKRLRGNKPGCTQLLLQFTTSFKRYLETEAVFCPTPPALLVKGVFVFGSHLKKLILI
jgi:hypothetical protein